MKKARDQPETITRRSASKSAVQFCLRSRTRLKISLKLRERFLALAFGGMNTREELTMADAQECRRQAAECSRQAAECSRLSQTDVAPVSEAIMRSMARSWTALANQMDRLDERDPVSAAHLTLAR